MNRDDFSKKVSQVAALRAGHMCSNPECRTLTTGPNSNPEKYLSIGIAAHINAASPKGPRYDIKQTPHERKSIYNSIWLCHNCSDIIDKDEKDYPATLLHEWKHNHKEFVKNLLDKKKETPLSRGGNGGQIHIITERLEGYGTIIADGGDGDIGGNGGGIYIDAKINNFKGQISANGGRSLKKNS